MVPLDLPFSLSYSFNKADFFVVKGNACIYSDYLVKQKSIVFMVDELVYDLYFDYLKSVFLNSPVIKLKGGECGKSWSSFKKIIEWMLQNNISRDSCVVAIGGGTIGDSVGMAASLYKRGVNWVYIPTTLLSLSDSCVGGKTALNYLGYKNIIGTFHPPKIVFFDGTFLKTLAHKHVLSGFAEIIKTSIIKSKTLFEEIEEMPAGLIKDSNWLEDKALQTITLKLSVIKGDWLDQEKTKRLLLNLGHSFGHAFESVSRYKLTHGQAVIFGLEMASKIAQIKTGTLLLERVKNIVSKFKFSKNIKKYLQTDLQITRFLEALLKDKKIMDHKINLIIPYELENVQHESFLIEEIQSFLRDYSKV